MESIHICDWELLHLPLPDRNWDSKPYNIDVPITPKTYDMLWLNSRAAQVSGTPCTKFDYLSHCDLRPLWGEMFEEKFKGYEFWGWVDLDVIFGDLDTLLPPLLDQCDCLNLKPAYTCGQVIWLKNIPKINHAYRAGPYKQILGDRRYFVWDDGGGRILPGIHMYKYMQEAGVNILFTDQSVSDSRGLASHVKKKEGKLYDITRNDLELLFCHFGNKYWPVDDIGDPISLEERIEYSRNWPPK